MKNIVISSGSLLMGGIERVLIEFLKNLDKSKYRIFLFIEKDFGKNNVFYNEVPKEIGIYFLKSEELIKRAGYYRDRKKNLYYKLLYNIQMKKERKIGYENFFKFLKEIEEKYGEIETFIDFDCGKNKIIKKVNIKNKLAWIHISMKKLLKDKIKIFRFGQKLKGYDKVVTICDEMSEELKEIYPYLKNKIVRCYNPFDFNRIIKLSEDYTELNDMEKELIKKDKYVVAISRLALEQKDYKTLIQGYKLYFKNGGKYKLYIVGDGSDKEKISRIIKENGLEKQIILLGQKKNPYVWMKNSKFFVHSSFYEGLPTVLIEAMICGKVVLSSDCSTGPKEILNKENCGVLFKTGDQKDLAEKLLNLTNEDLSLYQKKIKSRIEEFKMENVIKEYEKLIGE